MAKRKKKLKTNAAGQHETALVEHRWRLDRPRLKDYLAWCRENGFRADADKSAANMRQELAAYREQAALSRLAETRSNRDPLAAIHRVCHGEIAVRDIPSVSLGEIAARIPVATMNARDRQSLGRFLLYVGETTSLPTQTEEIGGRRYYYLDGLVAAHAMRECWIRPFREWRRTTHNRYRQFASLLRHLFAHYDVPAFFDSAWLRRDRAAVGYRRWFVRIAQGQSPRAAGAPVPMTKRIAHHFLQAPSNYSVEQAVRFAQVRALGGDARLCGAVIASRLGADLRHDDFWQTVLAFFVRHTMLDCAHVGPIVDYLQNQKFERQEVLLDNGQRRVLEPEQPNLSLRGRTPAALLARVDAWHRSLGRLRADDSLHWRASGIRPFTLVTGKGDRRVVWRIRELLSHAELVQEGRALRHCVASYAHSCKRGDNSIWSLTNEDAAGRCKRRQTIQVDRYKRIVQVRGQMNGLPSDRERDIVERWAKVASLRLALTGF